MFTVMCEKHHEQYVTHNLYVVISCVHVCDFQHLCAVLREQPKVVTRKVVHIVSVKCFPKDSHSMPSYIISGLFDD